MKMLRLLLFLSLPLFFTTSTSGQAVECNGFWVLYGVDLTTQDSDILLNLLSHLEGNQYQITHKKEDYSQNYGGLNLESVSLLAGGEFDTNTEMEANWFMDMRITPLFFSSKAITWESMPNVDPGIAAQVKQILSKYGPE